MTSKEFVIALAKNYGDWPGPGMKITVAEMLYRYKPKHLQKLFIYILKWYGANKPGPPVLAEILQMDRELPPYDIQELLPPPNLTNKERKEISDILAKFQKEHP